MRNLFNVSPLVGRIHILRIIALIVLVILIWEGRRLSPWKRLFKRTRKLLPNSLTFCLRRSTIRDGALLYLISWRLVPYRNIGLHFPLLGVGIRISLWLILLFTRNKRPLQWKRELLGDRSLQWTWVLVSIGIETIRRRARAITLGARLRVNIIIGGVLHNVLGIRRRRRGLFILCVLEVLVVLVQTYVFILLLCLYRKELE